MAEQNQVHVGWGQHKRDLRNLVLKWLLIIAIAATFLMTSKRSVDERILCCVVAAALMAVVLFLSPLYVRGVQDKLILIYSKSGVFLRELRGPWDKALCIRTVSVIIPRVWVSGNLNDWSDLGLIEQLACSSGFSIKAVCNLRPAVLREELLGKFEPDRVLGEAKAKMRDWLIVKFGTARSYNEAADMRDAVMDNINAESKLPMTIITLEVRAVPTPS